VNFAIPIAEPSESVIYGQVPGGMGWQLYVRGPQNMEILQPLDEEGRFEITDLKAGEYELLLQTPQVDYIERVTLDGLKKVEVQFEIAASGPETADAETATESQPANWTWQVEEIGPSPGFGVVRVRIPGHPGVAVRLWADGWSGLVRHTGDKPEYGPDVCEFAPLGKGQYYIQPEGMSQRAQVTLPGSRELWVIFTPGESDTPKTPPEQSGPTPEKDLDLFILVRSMPYDRPGFIQALRFAAKSNAPFGDDIEEAMKADKVIVMASSQQVTDADIARLDEAGCEVIRVTPPYYATRLRELLKDGTIP